MRDSKIIPRFNKFSKIFVVVAWLYFAIKLWVPFIWEISI